MDFHNVADVPVQCDDGALVGTREFDRGLRGLNVDERLIQGDHVTDGDLPGHDLGLDETFADVRQ
jgi:hypothetical protein